jgi:hypothetical protein
MNFKALGKNLFGTITGLNWTKYGIILGIILAYTGGVYGVATYRCNLKHERQKTEQAEQRTRTVVKEVQTRVPVVQKIEVESAKQKAEIANLKVKLDEALKNRPENTICDLSDAELAGVSALAAKTHPVK